MGRIQEIEKELRKLKGEINEAARERAQLEGKKENQLKRLQDDFGVQDIKVGKKKLTQLQAEKDKLSEMIETDFNKLQAEYEW